MDSVADRSPVLRMFRYGWRGWRELVKEPASAFALSWIIAGLITLALRMNGWTPWLGCILLVVVAMRFSMRDVELPQNKGYYVMASCLIVPAVIVGSLAADLDPEVGGRVRGYWERYRFGMMREAVEQRQLFLMLLCLGGMGLLWQWRRNRASDTPAPKFLWPVLGAFLVGAVIFFYRWRMYADPATWVY